MNRSAPQIQNSKPEKTPDQKPPTEKHHSTPRTQNSKSKQIPDQKPNPGRHDPAPQIQNTISRQIPDQNAPAKKHHSRHSHHHHKEKNDQAKPIDDLYYHLKKVHIKKGYSRRAASEIAYHESKKVMDKMERTFKHEMRKLEK
jgi:hypothetical protein